MTGVITASEKALEIIREFEGLRLESYKCPAGEWTIGYGETEGVVPNMTISREFAEKLLRERVESLSEEVFSLLKAEVPQHVFDVLISFSYNCGINALRRSTLLRLLNSGDRDGAALQFRRWIFSNGKILPGLVNRRAREERLFRGEA